jgi:porin
VKIALGLLAVLALGTPIARAQSAPPIADSVATAFSYTAEVVGDAAGGAKRDVAYLDAAAAQFTITISKRHHVGWPGLQLFAFVLGTHGGATSDLAGDVQGVSNLQAPARLRLEELWLQQNAFGNRASLLVGRYDLNSEYYRSQSTSLFVNSSFGIGPEFAQSGQEGPSFFPVRRWARASRTSPRRMPPGAWPCSMVCPSIARGESRIFGRGDGALLVGEFAVVERPDTGRLSHNPRFLVGRGFSRSYTGKLAIGAWYYTARFPDLADTMATGAPVEHRGSGGVYAIADRIVWSAGHGSPASVSAFAQIGVGDSRVNRRPAHARILKQLWSSPISCRSTRGSRCSRMCSTSTIPGMLQRSDTPWCRDYEWRCRTENCAGCSSISGAVAQRKTLKCPSSHHRRMKISTVLKQPPPSFLAP